MSPVQPSGDENLKWKRTAPTIKLRVMIWSELIQRCIDALISCVIVTTLREQLVRRAGGIFHLSYAYNGCDEACNEDNLQPRVQLLPKEVVAVGGLFG